MQLLPAIENGRVVLHLGGELDREGATAVARLISQSKGDFVIDFTQVEHADSDGLEIVEQAINSCPYRLSLLGADRLS